MPLKNNLKLCSLVSLFLMFFCCTPLFPQTGSGSTGANKPAAEGSIVNGKDNSPLNYENTMNMAPPRESNAFKTFEAIPDSQFEKKTKTGEEFIRKFSNSSLLPAV